MSWYIDHTLEVCLSWCELSRDAVLTTASFAMNVAAWNSLKILGVSEIHLMWLASGQRMSKVQDPPWGGPSSMCPRLPPVPAYVLELFMLVFSSVVQCRIHYYSSSLTDPCPTHAAPQCWKELPTEFCICSVPPQMPPLIHHHILQAPLPITPQTFI